MANERQRSVVQLREAWLEAALREEFGADPDVAARVLAADADAPAVAVRGPGSTRVALVLLGIAATALVWFWPERGNDAEAPRAPAAVLDDAAPQDPDRARGDTEVVPATEEELRAILADVEFVRLIHQHRTLDRFTFSLGRGEAAASLDSVGWFAVPTVTAKLGVRRWELGDAVGDAARAAERALACEIALPGRRVVRGFVGVSDADPDLVVFGTPTLGPWVLGPELADLVRGALPELDREAHKRFAWVEDRTQWGRVPSTVEHVVCRGVGDEVLHSLAKRTALRSVEIRAASPAQRQRNSGILPNVPGSPDFPAPGFPLQVVSEPPPQITDAGLVALAECRALRSVVVDGIAVSEAAFAALLALPDLQELRIRNGDASTLTGATLAARPEGRRLRVLELEQCPGIDDAGLARIAAVAADEVRWSFANNPITRDGLRASLAQLDARTLTLDGCELDGAVFELAVDAPLRRSLETLRLRHATVDLRGLERMSALRNLSVRECRVAAGALSELAKTRLSTLEIGSCSGLDGDEFVAAVALPSLRSVTLRNLREPLPWGRILTALGGVRGLRQLSLFGCRAQARELVPGLSALEGLRDLDLRDNVFPERSQHELRSALPDTRIQMPELGNRR